MVLAGEALLVYCDLSGPVAHLTLPVSQGVFMM